VFGLSLTAAAVIPFRRRNEKICDRPLLLDPGFRKEPRHQRMRWNIFKKKNLRSNDNKSTLGIKITKGCCSES
jgi:hypothetical protein